MLRFPPPLRPGDRVAVVAPSSPFPRSELLRGLAWLRDRYTLVMRETTWRREGYLAGGDDSRAEAIALAMSDAGVRAIVIARGGYGATRIVERLPWETFATSPKWIAGFSDTTALHAYAASRGIASVHAPNVTGLGRDSTPWLRARWLAALERPAAPHDWCNLHVIREGVAEGTLVGGNLSLVHALAAANRWHPPDGHVLAFEDVTERPYRLDRMLTSLREGGHLAKTRAIVMGTFDQCEPRPDGVTALQALRDRTHDLGIPVLYGAPFGHGKDNEAFVLGAHAIVRGDRVTVGGDPSLRSG